MKINLSKKEILTIPNALSLFRLILAVLMLWIVYDSGIEGKKELMMGLILLSALTDFLDGRIARRFHMVSELGKILDPIADKVTQGVLLISLLSRYKGLGIVFILFLIKESYMAVAGMKVLEKTNQNEGAMWYGKLNTTVFYIAVFLLIFVPDIPEIAANILIVIIGSFMLLSFVMYVRKYRNIKRAENQKYEKEVINHEAKFSDSKASRTGMTTERVTDQDKD